MGNAANIGERPRMIRRKREEYHRQLSGKIDLSPLILLLKNAFNELNDSRT